LPECRIAILHPDVVNQIAAGEVVERPASVVKELCENSLDAGATRVDVAVEQGGQRLVRVSDDGCGMTPEEARLSLERHATSKLQRSEDLLTIRSMGFRGEALPSIASVSRLQLRTRRADSEAGFALSMEGGALANEGPAGCRPGTTVEVSDLFFNTPARLKFLKSTATETAHITDVLTQLALGNPEIHISLDVDGRSALDVPPCGSKPERARVVLGRRGANLSSGRLEGDGLIVEAALGPPESSTRSPRSVSILVNRRVVRDRPLVHAVVAGHEGLLERGRFPLAVVHLEVAPSLLDVNVHPQKVEVRFSEPRSVFAAVRSCVRDIAARGWSPMAAGATQVYNLEPARDHDPGYLDHRARLEEAARRFWSSPRAAEHTARDAETAYQRVEQEPTGYFARMRPVGQALGRYLLCEGDGELVVIDLRGARERITLERLRETAGSGVPSQMLLLPSEVTLERRLASVAGDDAGTLSKLGFELDPFGARAFMVRAVPVWLAGADAAELVRDTLDALASGEDALERMACHAPGDALEQDEVEALLAALDTVDFSELRPVLWHLDRRDLERRFGR
jgi:DNA mismatch repair protein MutL